MIAQAKAKYIRCSPVRLRLLADNIRGKSVSHSFDYLQSINKRAAGFMKRAVYSAYSNVNKQLNLTQDQVFISSLTVDNGPALSRYRSMTMGRVGVIKHKLAHIHVVLDTNKAGKTALADLDLTTPTNTAKSKIKKIISKKKTTKSESKA